MSKEIIRMMVSVMDNNGYEQCGEGPNFINLNGGRHKVFLTWSDVYDFIRNGFDRGY